MTRSLKKHEIKKGALHPRNPHTGRYDFAALIKACPELEPFLKANPTGDQTIDFQDEEAVLILNQAILAHFYGVRHWQIPQGYLCPPIPGRADYIHYLADLLAESTNGVVPKGKRVRVLDIGTGANCIYPIVGSQTYGWRFIASEIDPISIKTAREVVQSNTCLAPLIKVIEQRAIVEQKTQVEPLPEKQSRVPDFVEKMTRKKPTITHESKLAIFKGVIKSGDYFDLTMCNPPFFASLEEAAASNLRKLKNLEKGKRGQQSVKLNFGGQKAELVCPGGEVKFIAQMARESVLFRHQVCWFTSLVAKSEHLCSIKNVLAQLEIKDTRVIEMRQGQKKSRLIAWSFLTLPEQQKWASDRADRSQKRHH